MEAETPLVQWHAQSQRSSSTNQHDTLDSWDVRDTDPVSRIISRYTKISSFTLDFLPFENTMNSHRFTFIANVIFQDCFMAISHFTIVDVLVSDHYKYHGSVEYDLCVFGTRYRFAAQPADDSITRRLLCAMWSGMQMDWRIGNIVHYCSTTSGLPYCGKVALWEVEHECGYSLRTCNSLREHLLHDLSLRYINNRSELASARCFQRITITYQAISKKTWTLNMYLKFCCSLTTLSRLCSANHSSIDSSLSLNHLAIAACQLQN